MVLELQRLAGNAAVAQLLAPEPRDEVGPTSAALVPGAGGPLEADLRARMESSFGTDFSDVRIHRGPEATASAAALGARAYTIGSDVVVADGAEDELTLAHELTHVAQQRSGPVDGTDHGDGLRVSDPSDPFERAAEAAATSALESSAPVGGIAPGPRTTAARSVQRDAEDPSDPVAAPAAAPAAPSSASSVMNALWQANVIDPLYDANVAFNAEPADAKGALQSTTQALRSLETALDGMPENDPNRDKLRLLTNHVAEARLALGPRAGVSLGIPDSEIADQLGKEGEEAVEVKKLLRDSPAAGMAPVATSGTDNSGKLPGC